MAEPRRDFHLYGNGKLLHPTEIGYAKRLVLAAALKSILIADMDMACPLRFSN